MVESVFAKYHAKRYRYVYEATLVVDPLVGGIPADPKVAAVWIKKNMGIDNEDLIMEQVANTMVENQMEKNDAVEEVINKAKLNRFKSNDEMGLYFEGRQVKAAIKEASNICWPSRRWGSTNKGTKGFWSEHVFIPEDKIFLGVMKPTDTHQRFVNTWRGNGIQYEQYVDDAKLSFTVITDADDKVITPDDWGELWACGEQQGIGASRGVGYGRYTVVKWDRVSPRSKA